MSSSIALVDVHADIRYHKHRTRRHVCLFYNSIHFIHSWCFDLCWFQLEFMNISVALVDIEVRKARWVRMITCSPP